MKKPALAKTTMPAMKAPSKPMLNKLGVPVIPSKKGSAPVPKKGK